VRVRGTGGRGPGRGRGPARPREGLSLADAARVVGRARGTEVAFHDETLDEAYASRAVYGAPDWQVDAWVSTYTAIASDVMARPTDAVERITGTPPLSLDALLRA